ncbi:leucyl aminopeptidase [Oceanospirillum multiglobuliferum]|uniref:Probable cytosol aminopeptidase n=1 Tax=Oceanospirillum multiglobuliferum TaxID=64969 RepID=A0A1T4RD81_9GAMM|nr:leucyl aminopeptidase [Oceanospirillum multiglobuliferum]OPX55183.1 leucyl aminopeptidase [Oceanospirillum multiglobuliferum]SKA13601.1 leucyl aminopeptidase [Oceanospirillum multiglobuliferum]
MQFIATVNALTEVSADCLVVSVAAEGELSLQAQQVDQATGGLINQIISQGDFSGKFGQSLLLPVVPSLQAPRLLLLGTGKAAELTEGKFRTLVKGLINEVKKTKVESLALSLDDIPVGKRGAAWKARLLAENTETASYVFDQMKSKAAEATSLTKISVVCTNDQAQSEATQALLVGQATGQGANFARTLGNLPPNICTPIYLAEQAEALVTDCAEMSLTVLDETEMAALGMNSLLAVAKGSVQAPRLIAIQYQGAEADAQPHVLVGKGVTFDSGGISLKPGEGMDEMKFDMCGAASVMGTMQMLKALKPKINVVGVVAAVENMPAGNATKPGDIVTTMSGKTVEILNTDAEGRLVLCDALTYIGRYNPASVVDIATLTGACIIALGHHTNALLANNDELAQELLAAGLYADDRAWQMPLWQEYQQQLDSNFADMGNIGGRPAGTITAACFLSRFTEDYRWAHLDIAGTAWHSGKEKGATGRPVPLLTQYLLAKAGQDTSFQL